MLSLLARPTIRMVDRWMRAPLLPLVFSNGQTLLSKFLTNFIGGSRWLFRSSSYWTVIAAISSGRLRAIGHAPTVAMEVEELED